MRDIDLIKADIEKALKRVDIAQEYYKYAINIVNSLTNELHNTILSEQAEAKLNEMEGEK